MKIRGNTVGTPMARPDWNQDNPKMADYIRNKPDINAMIAKGGTGNINMGGRNILGIGDIATARVLVASEDDEGFVISSTLINGDTSKPVAFFGGEHEETDAVIVRNVADGIEAKDAVNKKQLDKKAEIDNTKVGEDAWSSLNAVDKLCPSFEESGTVVQCEPVDGYPLTIVADSEEQLRFTICGKNLYNSDKDNGYPLNNQGYVMRGNGTFEPSSQNYKRTGFVPVSHLVGKTITLNYAPTSAQNPGMAFYSYKPDEETTAKLKAAYLSGGSGKNITVPEKAKYMIFSVATADAEKDIQIEIGSTASDYEPYVESGVEADHEAKILAHKGINTVFAYDHDEPVRVTVTGKSDPVAIIDKLTKAVLSLGGNV